MNEGDSGSDHDEEMVDSENDRVEHNRWLVKAVVAATARMRNRRRRAPQPMHNSRLTGSMRVEEILNGHEGIITGLISMKAATFRALSHLLASRGLLAPTSNMNVHEQLFIFLTICSQGATNGHVSYLFQHSGETTSRWFFTVLKVICSLKDEFITQPDYTTIQPLILEHADKYRPWFDVCEIYQQSTLSHEIYLSDII